MSAIYLRPSPRRAIAANPLDRRPHTGRGLDRRFRLPAETAARLDAEAASRGLDRSILIRLAVESLLDSLEPHNDE